MNNKFKCLLVALLIIPCIVVFTACDLFGGGNSATQYTLTVQNGTGGGKYDSGASVTATATIPSGKEFVAWLEGTTQISTANPYTFTLTKNITLTAAFKDVETQNLIPLVMSDLMFNKETQMLTWAAVVGVNPSNSYEIVIKNPQGQEIDNFYTAGTSISLYSLNLQNLENAGTATGIARGDGAATSDSAPKTITLNNYTEPPDQPEQPETKQERMEAFAAWETQFKQTLSAALKTPFDAQGPTINTIETVEIKPSLVSGKSTVNAYYISGTYFGVASFEISAITGAKLQDQLNDANSKVNDSTLAGASGDHLVNQTQYVIDSLIATDINKLKNHMPNGKLTIAVQSGANITAIMGGATGITTGGGMRNFAALGLIKVNGDIHYVDYWVGHINNGSTNQQIYDALRDNPNNVVNLSESSFIKLADSARAFVELKEEYAAWLAA